MAAFVQFKTNGTGGSTISSLDVTPDSNVTAGNLLVVVIRTANDTTISAPTATGVTFTQRVDYAAANPAIRIYSGVVSSTGSKTVNATFDPAAGYIWMAVLEYSFTNAWAYCASGSGTTRDTSGTELSSSSITTDYAEGVVVLAASQADLGDYTVGTDFTLRSGVLGSGGTHFGGVEDYLPGVALSGYTGTITSSINATTYNATVAWASFTAASGPTLPVFMHHYFNNA